jgi:hypothetical protein
MLDPVSPWAYAPATIAAFAAGVAAIIGAINKRQLDSVKTDVATVKTDVATVGTAVASVKDDTVAVHTLTNSAMGAQLLVRVELLQAQAVQAYRIAAITKEDSDLAMAKALDVQVDAARKIYQAHQVQQAIADFTGRKD